MREKTLTGGVIAPPARTDQAQGGAPAAQTCTSDQRPVIPADGSATRGASRLTERSGVKGARGPNDLAGGSTGLPYHQPPGAVANDCSARRDPIGSPAPPLSYQRWCEPGTRTRCGAVSPCADRLWGTGARRGPYTWHPSLTVDCKLTPDVLLLPRPASRPRTCGPPGWISVRRRMPTAPSSDRSHRSWGYPRH